jgi:hypothetical protein
MQRPQLVHSTEWCLLNSCCRNPVSGPERCPSFPLLVLVLRDTCNATLSVVDSYAASRCRTCLHPGDRLQRALQFRFDRFLGPSSPLWSRTSTHHYWAEDGTSELCGAKVSSSFSCLRTTDVLLDDLHVSLEVCAILDGDAGCIDVAHEDGGLLQLNALAAVQVSVHSAVKHDVARFHVGADASVRPNSKAAVA